jgi:hypothetical protein
MSAAGTVSGCLGFDGGGASCRCEWGPRVIGVVLLVSGAAFLFGLWFLAAQSGSSLRSGSSVRSGLRASCWVGFIVAFLSVLELVGRGESLGPSSCWCCLCCSAGSRARLAGCVLRRACMVLRGSGSSALVWWWVRLSCACCSGRGSAAGWVLLSSGSLPPSLPGRVGRCDPECAV